MWQFDKITNTFIPGALPSDGGKINACYTRLSQEDEQEGDSGSILNQELLYKGWFHHLLYMTAVHLWQNGTLQLHERRWKRQKQVISITAINITLQMKGTDYGTNLYEGRRLLHPGPYS